MYESLRITITLYKYVIIFYEFTNTELINIYIYVYIYVYIYIYKPKLYKIAWLRTLIWTLPEKNYASSRNYATA